MDKGFRYKLTGILISFTLILSLIIIVADYLKLKKSVKESLETQIQLAEDEIITSLSTIDKVYNVLDVERAESMKEFSEELVKQYERNPNFSTWDYKALKEQSGMDVFIINSDNVVIESSYEADIGLDFKSCCKNFGKLLDKRRESGLFTHDDLDIQQLSGEFKKFSYMPTPDKKYIIELSYFLEDKLVFKEFNFLDTMHRLEKENDSILSINVYNALGILLGDWDSEKEREINSSRKEVFTEAFTEFQIKELSVEENGQILTYRYIPYKNDKEDGISTNRVVEIAYYDLPFANVLTSYRNQFIFQMIAITLVTIILSIILARMISRPIHLAFHDVLTGLKNRAAFEDTAVEWLNRKKGTLQFMIIDLDNFKLVNDSLGHGEGDKLLVRVATIINKESGEGHLAARIGGDEFVVLFSNITTEKVVERADNMLQVMRESFSYLRDNEINLSISIGVAKAEEEDTIHSLYHKADLALYQSKKKGKDQYSIYSPNEK
ncbi:GGDEF domain-containing protein [Sporosarcina sp. PTS2304]|uniref:GGDEF domain-containing protein n=1 Tax=Sporosarcina sp. PTS2304 TaxID=2283194 RepID=UPI000E0E0297|nr:GGDEF domain-containing protein [Sporosarcina sp. PTS2304]AXH99424.1 GGDEF domain-containing protein [Sporosarcina sp. PTS2304]